MTAPKTVPAERIETMREELELLRVVALGPPTCLMKIAEPVTPGGQICQLLMLNSQNELVQSYR
jgi:hypothetical protein